MKYNIKKDCYNWYKKNYNDDFSLKENLQFLPMQYMSQLDLSNKELCDVVLNDDELGYYVKDIDNKLVGNCFDFLLHVIASNLTLYIEEIEIN